MRKKRHRTYLPYLRTEEKDEVADSLLEADELEVPLVDGIVEGEAKGETDSLLLALTEGVKGAVDDGDTEALSDIASLFDGLLVSEELSGAAPLLRDTLGLRSYKE